MYVTSSVGVNSMTICRYAEGSAMPHGICLGPDAGAFGGVRNVSVQGLPLLKPPYGTIAAFDLTKGELLWEIPNGETPDDDQAIIRRSHGVNLGRTGRAGQPPGALATKTLLIAAEPGYGPTPDGKRGSMLRAYDKRTGRELAALQLPAPQSGSPMTYMHDGRQFLVIAVSGDDTRASCSRIRCRGPLRRALEPAGNSQACSGSRALSNRCTRRSVTTMSIGMSCGCG